MFSAVKKLFGGTNWSLLFILNNTNAVYAMHDDSALRMLRYVGGYFYRDELREGWSVVLQYNPKEEQIPVDRNYFKNKGTEISILLLNKIEICEAITKPKTKEPIFMEVSTKKKIPIPSPEEQQKEIMKTENSFMKVKKKLTFYAVMNDQIFTPRR